MCSTPSGKAEYTHCRHKSLIFTHDRSPCHRLKVVSEYLKKSKVEVLDWPGNSRNLNPIKNLWSHMKKKWQKSNHVTAIKEV